MNNMNSPEKSAWLEISITINRTKYEFKAIPGLSFHRIKL